MPCLFSHHNLAPHMPMPAPAPTPSYKAGFTHLILCLLDPNTHACTRSQSHGIPTHACMCMLDLLVCTHPREFHYCPTPDCPQVYPTSPWNAPLSCPSCLARICLSCHVEYHEGVTCADCEDGGDWLFQEWMQIHDVKKSPGCYAPIERAAGCNNMTCTRCHTHTCWVCLMHVRSQLMGRPVICAHKDSLRKG